MSVGHANEKVNAAVVAQISRLSHVSSLYPVLPVVELAETLARITPGRLQQTFLAASGTEADETAVMLAQLHTGASEIVALRHGYSGRSMLAQSLTAHSTWRPLPTQVPGIKHAVSPYCYRCPLKLEYPSCGIACAKDIEELIRTTTSGRIAGFLAETIQGVGRLHHAAEGVLRGRRRDRQEVRRDLHLRRGPDRFRAHRREDVGIEHYGVEPDMMTMAKGIANGLPLGACIATPEIAASLKALTISTFGGNPVACAAANATIRIIEEEDLPGNAERMGRLLRDGFEDLKRRFPKNVGDVRGMGLMQAIELVVDETIRDRTPEKGLTGRIFEETRKRGLLIGKSGLDGNVFRVAPALNVGRSDVEEALAIIRESFEAAGAR